VQQSTRVAPAERIIQAQSGDCSAAAALDLAAGQQVLCPGNILGINRRRLQYSSGLRLAWQSGHKRAEEAGGPVSRRAGKVAQCCACLGLGARSAPPCLGASARTARALAPHCFTPPLPHLQGATAGQQGEGLTACFACHPPCAPRSAKANSQQQAAVACGPVQAVHGALASGCI
jgi:hypothetical protein